MLQLSLWNVRDTRPGITGGWSNTGATWAAGEIKWRWHTASLHPHSMMNRQVQSKEGLLGSLPSKGVFIRSNWLQSYLKSSSDHALFVGNNGWPLTFDVCEGKFELGQPWSDFWDSGFALDVFFCSFLFQSKLCRQAR